MKRTLAEGEHDLTDEVVEWPVFHIPQPDHEVKHSFQLLHAPC